MLVIHNGTTMFPDNQNPKQYRPGSTLTKPNGDRVGPASNGLDLGDGWFVAEPLAADPIPEGEEGISISIQMVGGVPKMVHQTQVITPEVALARRTILVKKECQDRIYSIADPNTQATLNAASSTGILTSEEELVWKAGVQWAIDMINACRALIVSGEDYTDDTKWPAVPAGVPELADKY